MSNIEAIKVKPGLKPKKMGKKIDEILQPSEECGCRYIKGDNDCLYAYINIERRMTTPDTLIFNEKLTKATDELAKDWMVFLTIPAFLCGVKSS